MDGVQLSSFQIRWLIRRDMPEVLEIENACFKEHAWNEEEFTTCLRQNNCIGMVFEEDYSHIRGYMIYELHKERYELLSLAVDPDSWREGIGTMFMDRMKRKVKEHRSRTKIGCRVSEENLDAQLFFRSQGFVCTGIINDAYKMCEGNAYRFEWELALDDMSDERIEEEIMQRKSMR